jgi:phospholipid/cholesterol/gamma-HCH transport system substrate-binding protein
VKRRNRALTKKFNVEIAVGIFLIIAFFCFAYLSIKLGDVSLFGENTYKIDARFASISGLKKGAVIEIAGVTVGKVSDIKLDQDDYAAVVQLSIEKGVNIQEDSIASIRTSGIIGDRYIKISPGGSDVFIKSGGEIIETESAINLEELVSKYIFESKK